MKRSRDSAVSMGTRAKGDTLQVGVDIQIDIVPFRHERVLEILKSTQGEIQLRIRLFKNIEQSRPLFRLTETSAIVPLSEVSWIATFCQVPNGDPILEQWLATFQVPKGEPIFELKDITDVRYGTEHGQFTPEPPKLVKQTSDAQGYLTCFMQKLAPVAKVVPMLSEKHGIGLAADQPIKKGDTIVVYMGTGDLTQEHIKDYSIEFHPYKGHILLSKKRHPIGFMNNIDRPCDANAKYLLHILEAVKEVLISLIAFKNIQIGEEIIAVLEEVELCCLPLHPAKEKNAEHEN